MKQANFTPSLSFPRRRESTARQGPSYWLQGSIHRAAAAHGCITHVIADLICNDMAEVNLHRWLWILFVRIRIYRIGTMHCIVFTLTFDSSPIKGEGDWLVLSCPEARPVDTGSSPV